MGRQGPTEFYAVAATPKGEDKRGVYYSWLVAKPYCINPDSDKPFLDAKFKKFHSLEEAVAFVNTQANVNVVPVFTRESDSRPIELRDEGQKVSSDLKNCKRRREDVFPGWTKSAQGAVKRVKQLSPREEQQLPTEIGRVNDLRVVESPLHVYTDGGCVGNGTRRAAAGYGVWFGQGDKRNEGLPLPGPVQTNQRAELAGVKRALEIVTEARQPGVPPSRPVVIHTDSEYTRKCVTEWLRNWKQNDWMNAKGQPVKNQDLIQAVDELIKRNGGLKKDGGLVDFIWVKGHSGDVGNEGADALASRGLHLQQQRRKK